MSKHGRRSARTLVRKWNLFEANQHPGHHQPFCKPTRLREGWLDRRMYSTNVHANICGHNTAYVSSSTTRGWRHTHTSYWQQWWDGAVPPNTARVIFGACLLYRNCRRQNVPTCHPLWQSFIKFDHHNRQPKFWDEHEKLTDTPSWMLWYGSTNTRYHCLCCFKMGGFRATWSIIDEPVSKQWTQANFKQLCIQIVIFCKTVGHHMTSQGAYHIRTGLITCPYIFCTNGPAV